MTLQVQTELLSLAEVVHKGIGFIIPSYQRPYVWSDEDVVKLFDDIKQAFIAKESHYFIGSTLSALNAETKSYELIDGQQRMTTLMLLSLAFKALQLKGSLAEVASRNQAPRLTFAIRKAVQNLLGSYAELDEFTKPGVEEIKNNEYLTFLDANLSVLKQQLVSVQDEPEFDFSAFSDYVYTQVQWVNNLVPAAMDLNRLFSSMNTAGIQLEPVDLLKAKLFKKITSEKPLYKAIWLVCENTNNYFERNVKALFPNADWHALEYKSLVSFNAELFSVPTEAADADLNTKGKTLCELLQETIARPTTVQQSEGEQNKAKDDNEEGVYCHSIISFELLLIHTLRVFFIQEQRPDVEQRIKSGNLLAIFERLASDDGETIKRFIRLLWEVRFQFDTWMVKWLEFENSDDKRLTLTSVSRSKSSFSRSSKELNNLTQLQAVRNFTGDRAAHYWLTAFLGQLVAKPALAEDEVTSLLENIDNQLSLTTQTQKEASFLLAKGEAAECKQWNEQAGYFTEAKGTRFEHYWFQKLEYLLWKRAHKSGDDKLKSYRITSKNSIEHVHPQNEEYQQILPDKYLHAFGNLVLLSPGENSSYSNQRVAKKKADFEGKPRYDALKLREIFEIHKINNEWWIDEIDTHQAGMLIILAEHYNKGVGNGE